MKLKAGKVSELWIRTLMQICELDASRLFAVVVVVIVHSP